MTSRDFCFWLQGFLEISDQEDISPMQVAVIKKHLNLVFIHEIDPSHGDQKEQDKLNLAHGPNKPPIMRC